jgi:hypothetical protein
MIVRFENRNVGQSIQNRRKTYALQINKLLFTFNGELPLCWIQHH